MILNNILREISLFVQQMQSTEASHRPNKYLKLNIFLPLFQIFVVSMHNSNTKRQKTQDFCFKQCNELAFSSRQLSLSVTHETRRYPVNYKIKNSTCLKKRLYILAFKSCLTNSSVNSLKEKAVNHSMIVLLCICNELMLDI